MKRIAFYGGSFDPPHRGHLTIARALAEQFRLDEFVFIPAFQAPHKKDKRPTSAFHRFAMLALATRAEPDILVSKIELDRPERPYTVETLARLKTELPAAEIFFVMGADSWADITTWREWRQVLTMVNIIVVTRPDYEIGFDHVTGEIRRRIVDLRASAEAAAFGNKTEGQNSTSKIFITGAVRIDVSATEIRRKIKSGAGGWQRDVPAEVARHIEKYGLYV